MNDKRSAETRPTLGTQPPIAEPCGCAENHRNPIALLVEQQARCSGLRNAQAKLRSLETGIERLRPAIEVAPKQAVQGTRT